MRLVLGLLVACGQPSEPSNTPATPAGPEPSVELAEPALRRLTQSEYRQTLADLFGPDLLLPTSLEPDQEEAGLVSIGAATSAISPRGVGQYEDAALLVAEQVTAAGPARDALMPCVPAAAVDEACVGQVLDRLGRRVWRRPLTSEERVRLVALATEAARTLDDFYAGLSMALGTMLQSPSFLYRVELGEADPDSPGRRRFTGWEMATRLSYLLWNTTPDDALLDAAEAGRLTDPTSLAAEVDRMLADPRARRGFRNYVDELLTLYELEHLSKDPSVFPAMRADLGLAAREETLAAVEALVFDRDDDFRTWLTTTETFVNPTLAMIYAVPAPSLDGFAAAALPDDGPRAGLLGQASVLALHAHPVSSSATRRGEFVREVLLCQEIPPPPANVDTSIPEPSAEAATLRDRVAVHLEDPGCAGCHRLTDPIGLGLENFDGIGAFRTTEAGATIDPSGELDGAPFADARELGRRVALDPAFSRCMAETVYAYAAGRRPGEGEDALVDWLDRRFAEERHSMRTLLRALATSDTFRHTGEVLP